MELSRVWDQPVTPTELEKLRAHYDEMAARLERLEQRAVEEPSEPPLGFSDAKLATIAASIYKARRRRLKLFDASLFAEPAWDMLLDLFIKTARRERVSTTSLSIAGGVPTTTGLRWIRELEKQGLVRRFSTPDDARLTLIEMTPRGYQLMRQYVTEGITRFEMPLPE